MQGSVPLLTMLGRRGRRTSLTYTQVLPQIRAKNQKRNGKAIVPEAVRTPDLEIILFGFCNLSLLPLSYWDRISTVAMGTKFASTVLWSIYCPNSPYRAIACLLMCYREERRRLTYYRVLRRQLTSTVQVDGLGRRSRRSFACLSSSCPFFFFFFFLQAWVYVRMRLWDCEIDREQNREWVSERPTFFTSYRSIFLQGVILFPAPQYVIDRIWVVFSLWFPFSCHQNISAVPPCQ